MWNPVEILNYNTRFVPCNNNNNKMNDWTEYCFTCDRLHYLDCILSDSIYHNTEYIIFIIWILLERINKNCFLYWCATIYRYWFRSYMHVANVQRNQTSILALSNNVCKYQLEPLLLFWTIPVWCISWYV